MMHPIVGLEMMVASGELSGYEIERRPKEVLVRLEFFPRGKEFASTVTFRAETLVEAIVAAVGGEPHG